MKKTYHPPVVYDVAFYLPSIGLRLVSAPESSGGGAETQILLLARALVARGLRVCVVCFPVAGDLPAEIDGVGVVVRPTSKEKQRVIGRLREMVRIARTLRRIDARVVVSRVAGPHVGLVGLIAKVLRRSFVHSSASLADFDRHATRMRSRDYALYRLGLRLADEVVVQTEHQARVCEERFGYRPSLIRSLGETDVRSRSAPEALLWVGGLTHIKQPLAFVELARALPYIPFWMVTAPSDNSGSLLDEFAKAAVGLPNLKLLKPCPRAELMGLVERAAAIVNTSDFEGMPNVNLEGWARGVPALTLSYDPDGVIEQYGLGEFAGGSFERFVAGARRLWNERDDCAELSERCRRYVAEHHAPEVVVAQWERVLGLSRSASEVRPEVVDIAD